MFEPLDGLRKKADTYWSSAIGANPYVEVFFSPDEGVGISGATLKQVFPKAAVPIKHGFPFHSVGASQVETPLAWGWLGAIPFTDEPQPQPPTYMWLLSREGAFCYREYFWEDNGPEQAGSVNIFHIIGLTMSMMRFLDRFSSGLELLESKRFRIGVALNNVRARSLRNEHYFPGEYVGTKEDRVEARLDLTLGQLRESREDALVNLLEEVAWQFRRQDWSRQDLVNLVRSAPKVLGREYAFPAKEQ